MTAPSWDDLQRRPDAAPTADSEFDSICARLLTGPDGRRLLALFRKRYFDAPANPLADERALRVRATQQQFVRDLELACERGLAAAAKRKAT